MPSIAQGLQQAEETAQAQVPDAAALKRKQDALATVAATIEAEPTVIAPSTPAGEGFIFDEGQPQVSSSLFVAQNVWVLHTGEGTREVVWAGVSGQDPKQGELLIISENDAVGFKIEGTYPSAEKHGALRATGASGQILQISAADGTAMKFDFATRTWL